MYTPFFTQTHSSLWVSHFTEYHYHLPSSLEQKPGNYPWFFSLVNCLLLLQKMTYLPFVTSTACPCHHHLSAVSLIPFLPTIYSLLSPPQWILKQQQEWSLKSKPGPSILLLKHLHCVPIALNRRGINKRVLSFNFARWINPRSLLVHHSA